MKFIVNDYITLKLENKVTNIYLNGELFRECKYILIRKTLKELEDIDDISSIDQFADPTIDNISKNLNHLLEDVNPETVNIPRETIFWAHASNFQVWVENNYETNLLHSNISFPLLKRLWQLNVPIAVDVFKKEIIKRFKEGYLNTILFLLLEGYHYSKRFFY